MRTITSLVVALFALFALAACAPKWHQLSANYSYTQYMKDFNKVYSDPSELARREKNFQAKMSTIVEHNKGGHSWKMGVNKFTDWDEEELKLVLGYDKSIGHARRAQSFFTQEFIDEKTLDLPTSVDWRTKGVVSPVKDQGRCGSCWSFASAETIESVYALKTGKLFTLSEQHILDCTPNPMHCGGSGGCGGGTAELAFAKLKETGISTEWTYPYTSYQGENHECAFDLKLTPAAVNVTDYYKIPTNQKGPLMQAIAKSPVAISVDASSWHLYESGVFKGCNATSIDINHAVQLVGYDQTHDGEEYFIVRNSWGPAWGENGYIRLPRTSGCGVDYTPKDGTACDGSPDQVTVCGSCGVFYDNCVPIV